MANVSDSVTDLLYYNRKECEDLPLGSIEEAIEQGEITAYEIVEQFRRKLAEGLR